MSSRRKHTHPIEKECPVCGEKFLDESINRVKKACSNHCRRILYNNNGFYAILKDNHYKRYYGITFEQYNKLFELQGGCCAICGKHQSEFNVALAVDHDHETGNIRGLLCSSCNSALGYVNDNPDLFLSVIEYLENGGAPTSKNIIDPEQAKLTRQAMAQRAIEFREWREKSKADKQAREEMIETFLRGGYSDN